MRRIWAVVLPVCVACSDAGLQPLDDTQQKVVDDRLDITGDVCTADPTEAVFPVKILFIVDCSGSMQFTDPSNANTTTDAQGNAINAQAECMASCQGTGAVPNCAQLCAGAANPGRQTAVQKVVDRFKNNPAVSFAMVRFNGRVTINGSATSGSEGFTNNPAVLNTAIAGLAQADITTDYQGALTSAYQLLERDMVESNPVDRIRTKYVVIFVSDGAPDPVCKEGCGNDVQDLGIPGVVLDSWCDVPRDRWCDNFNVSGQLCKNMQQWYPSMAEPCKAYNTETQIVQKVTEIIDLGKQYGVGEIRMHTAFLFVAGLPQVILDLFSADPVKSERVLRAMAKAGGGLFRNFTSGQSIDFLDINYSSVARPFGMTNFIVTNPSARPWVNKLVVDSDGDGVDDLSEFEAKLEMNEQSADSDNDGYNDKLELDRYKAGFDPGKANIPAKPCPPSERVDLDGDGLNSCEEKIVGTDPKVPDTDRDRIPDGVEFFAGTDPTRDDSKLDVDFDGKLSGEEINTHSSPTVADPEVHAELKYLYDVHEQAERPDRRRCYDFSVKQVRLVTTLGKNRAGSLGYNEIMIYFGEGPADDPRDFGNFKAACVRAQYVTPNFKFPADGKVHVPAAKFMPLHELMKARADAASDPTKDPCVGAPLP
ncbi:MAG: VWA domain-containing protein [Deltaproteobacteria bacterium]|nr:VWA domain-containing protein [Deltaproteobacteria bacterium]